jgi:hypothetical protein
VGGSKSFFIDCLQQSNSCDEICQKGKDLVCPTTTKNVKQYTGKNFQLEEMKTKLQNRTN